MRVRHGFWVAILAILVCLPSATAQVKWTPVQPGDHVGYLTWNGGKGGIAWDAAAVSEDPGGPPVDASENQARDLEYYFMNRIHPDDNPLASPIPPDEFVAAPLKETAVLDPRGNIILDLFIDGGYQPYYNYYDPCAYSYQQKAQGYDYYVTGSGSGSPDPWLVVELFADGKYVGGDSQGRGVNWYYADPVGRVRPPDPAGYTACRYAFHPEVESLPAGTVLTVKITHLAQSRGFQYGMGGDHRSLFRLPLMDKEEQIFRSDPGAAPAAAAEDGAPGKGSEESGSALIAGGALGMGLLAGAAAMRRRNLRPILVVAILVGVAGSGCVSGASKSTPVDDAEKAGSVKNTMIPIGNGTLGNGSIFGVVHDDFNVFLANVHVSLLGSNLFTSTDSKGRFTLKGIPAGFYSARLDKKEYRSFETKVEVKVGFDTRLDVTMLPLVDRVGDARPHPHDYWGAATSKVAMDKSLGRSCSTTCYVYTGFRLPGPEEPGAISSILPGTRDVEVTVTWDETKLPYKRVGLVVGHNGDLITNQYGSYSINQSFMGPRASGQPFHMRSTWEMNDPGHQGYSTWTFSILPVSFDKKPSNYVPNLLLGYEGVVNSQTYTGDFHVKVVLHKGVVPLEPAHPDLWSGADAVEIKKGSTVVYHPGVPYGVLSVTAATCLAPDAICQYNRAYLGPPQKIVAPETKWLEVTVNQTADSAPHFDWKLHYRSGDKQTSDYQYDSWPVAPSPTRDGWKSTKWKIPIKAGEADPIYARFSNWYFVLYPEDDDAAYLDYMTTPNLQLQVSVVAHKTDM